MLNLITGLLTYFNWLLHCIFYIFTQLLSPLYFVYNFVRGFSDNAFSSPTATTTFAFPEEVLTIVQAIPYWSFIGSLFGIILLVISGIAIIKLFLK
jgi:hypothetical protein